MQYIVPYTSYEMNRFRLQQENEKISCPYTKIKITNHLTFQELRLTGKIGNSGVRGSSGVKQLNNLSRAKSNIKSIIELNMFSNSSFITLTFADNVQDYDFSSKCFKKFIKDSKIKRYLCVKELQERGAIHYHLIVFNAFYEDEYIKSKWPYGFSFTKEIDIIDCDTAPKISNYLSKYLVNMQKNQLVDFNKKMYTTSKDVVRPFKLSINYPIDTLNHLLKQYNKVDNKLYVRPLIY